jgi:hypothetical protein
VGYAETGCAGSAAFGGKDPPSEDTSRGLYAPLPSLFRYFSVPDMNRLAGDTALPAEFLNKESIAPAFGLASYAVFHMDYPQAETGPSFLQGKEGA